jgi:hypothetical protein
VAEAIAGRRESTPRFPGNWSGARQNRAVAF